MEPGAIKTNRINVRRARGRIPPVIRHLSVLACFLLAISSKATVPLTDLPNLGALNNFIEFGNQQVDNLATINGNVGVSAGGMLQLNAPATINGDISLAYPVTLMQMGLVTGVTYNDQSLTTDQNTVISASAALGKLAADETISGSQTMALNFDVPASQVEVVDLEGGLNLNNQNITLTGGGDLVLNIEDSFSLNGSAVILGDPANIYINYEGESTITSYVANTIDGMLFDPDAAANLAGVWNGSIDAGDGTITLESGAELNPVPEPGTRDLILTGIGALLFPVARRRFWRMRLPV
ncbi:MAG TPA: hypothetical protein VME24_12325 [Alphaproteobacteria bacterium]|nr:hypothetical protein [Alphaproteobacteria bacterium]